MPWRIIDRLLLPAFFFLFAFVIALTYWQLLMSHWHTEIQVATQEQALFVKSKIESELKSRILMLERLAERSQGPDGLNEARLESDAGLVMTSDPAYQGIEWVEPTFQVKWATARTSDGPGIGLNLGANAAQRAALEDSAKNRRASITSPTSSPKEGLGFVVFVPVYSKNKLTGFLAGSFQYDALFSDALQGVAQDYRLSIYDGAEAIYTERAGNAAPGGWAESVNARVQQSNWKVDIWPKPQTLSNAMSPLPSAALIGGILMAALMAFAVYLAETAWKQAKAAVATNKELEKEIAGRQQAEEALRQAQKMEAVGRLAGGVAHDFNNLLMVIRGHAALLLKRVTYDSALYRELNEILKTTDRASSLTRRLLAFSRKQVLQLRVLDLNTLVAQVQELLPPVLGDDITLTVRLDPDLGRVKADAAQMEQVIMNLVFNARDAMPGGGELTIETSNAELDEAWVRDHAATQVGPHVRLTVRDTGHGMNKETLSHVFEPFFTTKETGKGTGLGLASVYGTVTQSGGCITASSKPGEGATIEIYLPRVEEAVEEVEIPEPAPQTASGAETILVVEDDDAVRRMTREFLRIKGYTVIEASRATDAIRLMELHKEAIDLVLTDVLMPGMKGRELVEHLGKLQANMKVLYMSAYTEDAALNIGVLDPGTEFIEKPFGPDELAGKVRKILGRPSAMRMSSGAA